MSKLLAFVFLAFAPAAVAVVPLATVRATTPRGAREITASLAAASSAASLGVPRVAASPAAASSAASLAAASSAASLGVPRVLASLASHARTQPGRRLCLEAEPAPSAEAARAAYRVVSEAIALCAENRAPPLDHELDALTDLEAARQGEPLSATALQRIGFASNALARLACWSATPEGAITPALAAMAGRAAPPARLREQLCGAFGLGERVEATAANARAAASAAALDGGRAPQPPLSSAYFPLLAKRRLASLAAQQRLEDAYGLLLRGEGRKGGSKGKGAGASGPVRRCATMWRIRTPRF